MLVEDLFVGREITFAPVGVERMLDDVDDLPLNGHAIVNPGNRCEDLCRGYLRSSTHKLYGVAKAG